MERAGRTPQVGVAPQDLVRLATEPGPVATVYLATPASVENAAQRSASGWKTHRYELETHGAPQEVLDHIEAQVADAHLEGEGVAIVAGVEGIRLVEHLPEVPRAERARWSDLASLAPLLEHRQADVGHVVAIVDRLGADVTARWRGQEVSETVKGDATFPITRVQPGGWAQKHYQLKVQDSWERNAHQVAAEVTRLADEAEAELIVIAGDVRATQLLRAALPGRLGARVREAAGTRAADGGDAHTDRDLHRLLRTAVAADTVELLRTFQQEQGQHDRAANGPAATLEALRRSQVDVLLIHDDPGDERTWWYGTDPLVLGTSAGEVESLGAEGARRGRLSDVAIRAALGSGAAVRVVPAAGPLEGGIGAILRWGQQAGADQGGSV